MGWVIRPGKAIETYFHQVYGVQQQKKDKHMQKQKKNPIKFWEIPVPQPKKHKLYN